MSRPYWSKNRLARALYLCKEGKVQHGCDPCSPTMQLPCALKAVDPVKAEGFFSSRINPCSSSPTYRTRSTARFKAAAADTTLVPMRAASMVPYSTEMADRAGGANNATRSRTLHTTHMAFPHSVSIYQSATSVVSRSFEQDLPSSHLTDLVRV